MNIVLCSDENYAGYSATVMVSALENSCDKESFNFFLLTPGLTDDTQVKLKDTIASYGASLDIINVDTSLFSSLDIDLGRFGVGALLRLYMHLYIPETIKKVIYLDCDLVILGDLKELWEKDLKHFALGAVTDLCSPKNHEERLEDYFNSGVLLINVDKWRECNVGEKSLQFLSKNTSTVKYLDQDALNYLFCAEYLHLNLAWNFQPASYSAYERKYKYLKSRKEELAKSIEEPKIVHFIGKTKPWHTDCEHPLQPLFIYFSQKTPWPIKIELSIKNKTIKRKIKSTIKKIKINSRRKMTKYQIKS